MNEVWKPVTGYEGLYDVSNLGNVRSYKKTGRGKGLREKPKPLRLKTDRDGYRCVDLCRDGQAHPKKVHRLVVEAFTGEPIPVGMHVCHGNGDPGDNRLENLRIDTPKANSADRIRHGRAARKLNVIDVKQMKIFLDCGHSKRELADNYGVNLSTVYAIAAGKSWNHVPSFV